MVDEINEQKIQNILKLINELADCTESLDVIKNHCIDLQNKSESETKSKYLIEQLKDFTVYPELNDLIQGLKVKDLCYDPHANIGKMGEEIYFQYKIILNELIELDYNYSFTFSGISTLYYRTYGDSYHSEIVRLEQELEPKLEPDENKPIDAEVVDAELSDAYKAFKLKDTSMDVFKKFLSAMMKAVIYTPDSRTKCYCVESYD